MPRKEPLTEPEEHYQQTLRILNQQKTPSALLCTLMNWLESYRQSRKMGWSRAWNKYGLMTFQSFKLDQEDDQSLIQAGFQLLSHVDHIPKEAQDFVQNLAQNKQIMAFIFFSEYSEKKQDYESITLSLGRRVNNQPRFRDRLDIIFDISIHNNQAQQLDRIRIYIDPFQADKKDPLWQTQIEKEAWPTMVSGLFSQLCDISWSWDNKPEKHWQHWTSQYIDYFGPRRFDLQHSFLQHPYAPRQKEPACITS
ncbi:MAG: hypothetical protein Q9M28_09315 [Mariprofundaceae bacterium]|nr:hypothetical protein [Mariprofundaceae bacterium]